MLNHTRQMKYNELIKIVTQKGFPTNCTPTVINITSTATASF